MTAAGRTTSFAAGNSAASPTGLEQTLGMLSHAMQLGSARLAVRSWGGLARLGVFSLPTCARAGQCRLLSSQNGRRPADWLCPGCGVNCFGTKNSCFKCGSFKPGPSRSAGLPGDWPCPGCGINCFASKTECFKCGTSNPNHPSAHQGLPGDWPCPGCGINCFASKPVCFKCGTPKPASRQRNSVCFERADTSVLLGLGLTATQYAERAATYAERRQAVLVPVLRVDSMTPSSPLAAVLQVGSLITSINETPSVSSVAAEILKAALTLRLEIINPGDALRNERGGMPRSHRGHF